MIKKDFEDLLLEIGFRKNYMNDLRSDYILNFHNIVVYHNEELYKYYYAFDLKLENIDDIIQFLFKEYGQKCRKFKLKKLLNK